MVLKHTKSNKFPYLGHVPAIIWKDQTFHYFCKHTFTSLIHPSKWLESGIIPFPKKGDFKDLFYCRGTCISLIPTAAKIYNKLILNHLIPQVDLILPTNQNGFRKGKSTIAQILTVRRIIEEMNRYKKDVVICFVDFKKSFDSISRETMFEILPLCGIPNLVVKAIASFYTNTKAVVVTPDGQTDFFTIEAGLLQGDTLAPFLFITVLDYVLQFSK